MFAMLCPLKANHKLCAGCCLVCLSHGREESVDVRSDDKASTDLAKHAQGLAHTMTRKACCENDGCVAAVTAMICAKWLMGVLAAYQWHEHSLPLPRLQVP